MSERFMPSDGVVVHPKDIFIIFLINTSGSMMVPPRMERANQLLCSVADLLKELQEEQADSLIYKICIMGFDDQVRWLQDPVPVSEYVYQPVKANPACGRFGRALRELNSKLSRNAFFRDASRTGSPFLCLLTDGTISDDEDIRSAFEEIRQNGWFKHSQRYIVLLDEDSASGWYPNAGKGANRFAWDGHQRVILTPEDFLKEARDCLTPHTFILAPEEPDDEDRTIETTPPVKTDDNNPFADLFPGSFD